MESVVVPLLLLLLRVARFGFVLAALLPWDLIPLVANASRVQWSGVQLTRLLRLWWGPQGVKATSLLLRHKLQTSVGMSRLIAVMPLYLLLLHLFACAWQLVGVSHGWEGGWQAQDPALEQYLSTEALVNATGQHYLRALYWSAVVLVTVGFGDIVPTQFNEMVVTMLAMFTGVTLACAAVALLLNEILFQDAMARTWQARLDMAAEFVRTRRLPRRVAQRIDEYHVYQWTYLRGVNEASFFSKLPTALRSEALVALNDSLLRKVRAPRPRLAPPPDLGAGRLAPQAAVPTLTSVTLLWPPPQVSHFTRASDDLIADLARLLYPLLFLPDEFLHRAGQTASCASLLVRGKVQELTTDISVRRGNAGAWSRRGVLRESLGGTLFSSNVVRTFSEGDCILGEASLGLTRVKADLVAKTFVEVRSAHAIVAGWMHDATSTAPAGGRDGRRRARHSKHRSTALPVPSTAPTPPCAGTRPRLRGGGQAAARARAETGQPPCQPAVAIHAHPRRSWRRRRRQAAGGGGRVGRSRARAAVVAAAGECAQRVGFGCVLLETAFLRVLTTLCLLHSHTGAQEREDERAQP